MKDVSQCLLSLIDEFDKYHSKIVKLEDEKELYTKNIQSLQHSRDKILQGKDRETLDLQNRAKASETLYEEHQKLHTKYKFMTKIVSQLRDENAHMNSDLTHLEEENSKYSKLLELLTLELEEEKKAQKDYPQDTEALSKKIILLEDELNSSKKYFTQTLRLEEENIELKKKYQEFKQDKMYKNAQHHTLHEKYLQMQKQRNRALKSVENLEYEYQALNRLYQHSLEEKEDLKKKQMTSSSAKDPQPFQINSGFNKGNQALEKERAFVDIDSLIEGINLDEERDKSDLLV